MNSETKKNLLLLFVSIIITVFFVEITYRILIKLGYSVTLTSIYSEYPYDYFLWSREGNSHGINNRLGYADIDYPIEKRGNIKRVAIVGDSFVEALQVNIPEKMGPVLQETLNQKGNNYEVMSFGRSGEYPAFYYLRLVHLISQLNPDIVFICIYSGNDFRNADYGIERKESGLKLDQYLFFQVEDANRKIVVPYSESNKLLETFEQRELEKINHTFSVSEKVKSLMGQFFILYSEIPSRLNHFSIASKEHKKMPTLSKKTEWNFDKDIDELLHGNDVELKAASVGVSGNSLEVKNSKEKNGYASLQIPVEPGQFYKFGVYIKKGTSPRAACYVGQVGDQAKYLQYSTDSLEWTQFFNVFRAESNNITITLQVGSNIKNDTGYFDNVSIEPVEVDYNKNDRQRFCDADSIFINSLDECWRDSKIITSHFVSKIKSFAESKGIRLFFVGIPPSESFYDDEQLQEAGVFLDENKQPKFYSNKLAKKYHTSILDIDMTRPNNMLKEIMKENDVTYIDLATIFRNNMIQTKKNVYCHYSIYYGHLNTYGHTIVADAMASVIR